MKTFQELNTAESFHAIAAERAARIDAASTAAIPQLNPVNRLAKRLHPDRQYMKIAQVTELAPDTKRFRFVPDPARGTTECAPFLAGQYLNIHLTINGMPVNRAYSISSSPKNAREGYYELTLKYVQDGLVSRYVLDNWKEGDEVELSGPAGTFYYSPLRDAKTVVCLAGGSGVTPFLSLANAIADGDEDFRMILLYGSRTEDAPAERRSRALAPTKDTWAESWERDGGVRVKEQLREGVVHPHAHRGVVEMQDGVDHQPHHLILRERAVLAQRLNGLRKRQRNTSVLPSLLPEWRGRRRSEWQKRRWSGSAAPPSTAREERPPPFPSRRG